MEVSTRPPGSTTRTIIADDRTDRERWRCPNNHTEWEPRAGGRGIHCIACARHVDTDPEYRAVLDTHHDERVPWGEVALVFETDGGSMIFRGQIQGAPGGLAVEVPEVMREALGSDIGDSVRFERDRGGDPDTIVVADPLDATEKE